MCVCVITKAVKIKRYFFFLITEKRLTKSDKGTGDKGMPIRCLALLSSKADLKKEAGKKATFFKEFIFD